MSYHFVNKPDVRIDIISAIRYYQGVSPELAKQFIFRIREAKDYIAKSPLGFQVKHKNVRTLILKQFPYHIHYFIDESLQQIIILAIIHAYKNPKDYSIR